MTAHSTLETAIEAMKRGAYDFITKPFATSELRALVQKAFEKRAIVAENEALRARSVAEQPRDLARPLRADAPDRRPRPARRDLAHAPSSSPARAGRARSGSRARSTSSPTGADEAVPRRQLRRHPRGADRERALRSRQGRLHRRDCAPPRASSARPTAARSSSTRSASFRPALQVKLLRVLQERKVRSVGAAAEVTVDVRVLAATNRNVEEDVKAGKFRQDLYYRLNVIRIEVPPLRERREDIAELAEFFLARCAAEHDKEVRGFSPDALRALDAYAVPGQRPRAREHHRARGGARHERDHRPRRPPARDQRRRARSRRRPS